YADFEATPLLVGRALARTPTGTSLEIGGRTVGTEGAVAEGALVVVRLLSAEATEGELLAFDSDHPVGAPGNAAPGTRVR
ncbi:MAG: hypothetical protein L3J80_01055, partial [Thermoplasmata archaeon]|nr:hypothetical protein [Thermoplasmata archaeon]